jgi:hypothetical protein
VPLKNGNVLFCGAKQSADRRTAGLMTILGGSVHLVEQRVEIPNDG